VDSEVEREAIREKTAVLATEFFAAALKGCGRGFA